MAVEVRERSYWLALSWEWYEIGSVMVFEEPRGVVCHGKVIVVGDCATLTKAKWSSIREEFQIV